MGMDGDIQVDKQMNRWCMVYGDKQMYCWIDEWVEIHR